MNQQLPLSTLNTANLANQPLPVGSIAPVQPPVHNQTAQWVIGALIVIIILLLIAYWIWYAQKHHRPWY